MIKGFIHWENGKITETALYNSEKEIEEIYKPTQNAIDGIEFYNLDTGKVNCTIYL